MNLNTAVTHFGTAIGPAITGAIVGETSPGGPLTHFGTAGIIASFCGCVAIAISLRLKRYSEPLDISVQSASVVDAQAAESNASR